MSNSKNSRFKKILCTTALSIGFLASAFTGINYHQRTEVNASANTGYIIEDITTTQFGSGANFNVSTSTTPSTNVTGWSANALSDKAVNSSYIKKGVVNFESATYFNSDEWELSSQPSMPTNKDDPKDDGYYKNLMINSYNGAGRFGYESNNSITLQENSFYKISVLVYTHKPIDNNTEPRASIYLTNLVEKDDEQYNQTKFEYFSTLGAWETYSYYIDTDMEKTIKLQLWLGSETADVQGAVFFNKIKIERYSEDSYISTISQLNDTDTDNFNIISFRPEFTQPVENSSFEDVTKTWNTKAQSNPNTTKQLNKIVDVNTFTNVNSTTNVTTPYSNCSANNQNALFMYNKFDGYQAVESSKFTIKQHTYYKLSFWAKSDCKVGDGATVMLVDNSKENAIESASLTLSTSPATDNEFRNNWTKYSFYIYGASNKDTEATIQIWLGTTTEQTSGYVFIDDFRLQQINYETYSANSSATNSTAFNLNNSDDKYTIVNGEFNITKNESIEETYPTLPSGWERKGSKDENSTFSGIINTKEEIFNANLDKISNQLISPTKPEKLPYTDNDNNNVLMIGSSNPSNCQSFESSSFTLEPDNYYTISFYVMTDYTQNSKEVNYGARFNVTSDTKTIFDLYNIRFDDNKWHKIEAKIKTGTFSESAIITLSFDNWNGYVFFDSIQLKTISETIYNSTQFDDAEKTYLIDLNYDNFNLNTFDNVPSKNGIETPNNWSFNLENKEDGVFNGIINSNNPLINDTPPSLSKNDNYLYIFALHNGYYSYATNDKFTFDSKSFYKISVNILTNNIVRDYIEEDDDTIYGASIKLGDSSKILLKGIQTNGVWKTYTIYASFKDSMTSNIVLALGYTNEDCMGEVLFDNLRITTLDSETYTSEINDAVIGTYATYTDYQEPKEDTEEETTPWENTFNWLVIPSLITALAIIISVIGYYIKKININKKPRIKTNYDRRKTLDKEIDKRERIALRKQIIEELKAELASIDQEIEDFNILANEKIKEVKEQIEAEQEELKKQQLELEIRKKEATAERERQLKENVELISNTRAEKEFNNFIAKLDRQELVLQRKISDKEFKLATAREINNEKLERYTARQEYIRLQIAKIEQEIEEIAKQEQEMWDEYRAAKEDAKRRKMQYKAQLKVEKDKKKTASETNKTISSKAKKSPTNDEQQINETKDVNSDSSNN